MLATLTWISFLNVLAKSTLNNHTELYKNDFSKGKVYSFMNLEISNFIFYFVSFHFWMHFAMFWSLKRIK